MDIARSFLFLLSLFCVAYPTCNNSISIYIPAVSDNAGSLVGLDISLKEGEGDIFVSIYPRVGMAAQDSIKTAINSAYMFSPNPEKCDFMVKFHSPNTEYVDGPSAGVSIASATYILLNNLSFRQDTIITGGIDEFGRIIPVGGIYEKTLASARKGYKYVIVPEISVPEKIMISRLKNLYEIYVIEENSFAGVLDFVAYNHTKNETLFSIPPEEKIEIQSYPFNGSKIKSFSKVVLDMVALNENAAGSLSIPKGFDSLKEYYSSALNNTKNLNEKGYAFTSANRAFLDYISISSIENIDHFDIQDKKKEVEDCLFSLEKIGKTRSNFEWAASSELREYWAKDQLDLLQIRDNMLEEEKYYLFNSLMYADAWCQVSASLRKVSKEESMGAVFNESVLKDYAQELLNNISEYEKDPAFSESRHIKTAKKLFEDGKYSASIYDSLHFIYLENSNCKNFSKEELNSLVNNYSKAEPVSLWGKIYHTQGYYLYLQNDSNEDACQIYSYSFALDNATAKMIMLQPKEQPINKNFCFSGVFLMAFLAFFILKKQ